MVIDKFDYDVFKNFISFVYNKSLNLKKMSINLIMNIYSVFHFYKVKDGLKYIQFYCQEKIPNIDKKILLEMILSIRKKSVDLPDKKLQKIYEAIIITHAKSVVEDCNINRISIDLASSILNIAFGQLDHEPQTCFAALERAFKKFGVSRKIFNLKFNFAMGHCRWHKLSVVNILNSKVFTNETKVSILQQKNKKNELKAKVDMFPKDETIEIDVLNCEHTKQMSKLLAHEISQDVSFKIGDQIITAHKAILLMNSEVFDAMFFGELKETGTVEITDITIDIFQLMIKLLYFQPVDLSKESSETLYDLYAALHKYQCHNALAYLQRFILHRHEDIFLFYEMAQSFFDPELEAKCYERLQSPSKAVNSVYFMNAKPETVNAIFTRDDLKDFPDAARLRAIEWYIDGNEKKDPAIKYRIMKSTENINFENIEAYDLLRSDSLTDRQKVEFYAKKHNFVKKGRKFIQI
ncbi:uncharacterized protein LOC134827240 [Culicoides brevitarsis]|uniref:uncharacterized protein LOC134827240 n=1 Tax=Culicoides brevitarsis TaxID=469753 RepID=UPI00307C415A